MDRCVADLTQSGHTKEAAIKICYTSLSRQAGTNDVQTNHSLEEHLLMAAKSGEIIYFKNRPLAPAGVNGNQDGITEAGIDELVKTLPWMPITIEHGWDKIGGFIVAARRRGDTAFIDGAFWARRYPAEAEKLKAGQYALSVEAVGETAVCSICNQSFTRPADYCEHIGSVTARREHGAVRWLHHLKGIGAALTETPAAAVPNIDANSITLLASLTGDEFEYIASASLDERTRRLMGALRALPEPLFLVETFEDYCIVEDQSGNNRYALDYTFDDTTETVTLGDTLEPVRSTWEPILGANVVDLYTLEDEENFWNGPDGLSPLQAKDLSYQQRKRLRSSQFALIQDVGGRKVRRFPIPDCEHARKALQLLPKAKNLSDAERAMVRKRAIAYLEKHCGGYSGETTASQIDSTTGGVNMEQASEFQQQVEQLKAQLDQTQQQLEAAQARHQVVIDRLLDLTAALGTERARALLPELADMTQPVFETILRMGNELMAATKSSGEPQVAPPPELVVGAQSSEPEFGFAELARAMG